MPTLKLKRVRKGEPIRAEDWNAVAETIESIANVRSGSGIEAKFTPAGLLIGLLGSFKDRFVLSTITAAPPPLVPVRPSLCRYSAVGIAAGGVVVTNVFPEYGRPVVNDEVDIYPCLVGHLCFICRNPQNSGLKKAELFVFSEVTAKGDC